GVVLAVVVAAMRYDLDLSPSPAAPLVAVGVAAVAAMIGYGMATALPPRIAQLLTQVLVFVILLFSPITFPSTVLPGWLSTLHEVLPMEPMADLVRASLAPEVFTVSADQVAVVIGWGLGATALTLALMSRRA
ncbi:ABC transporter permease, partial [Pseudactinotalea sp.]|uniref:ABC transporter permease n=1 Tax=Pseudactinotalea sp. TaxID=1926260 RepID=UPI003B3B9E53